MRPFARTTSHLLLGALGLLFLSSCTKPNDVTLYDPNVAYHPAPTITAIAPAGSAFAGMDTIIIQGTNFSTVLAENSVFFNAQPAALLASTATQITLKAPLVTVDSIGVRISVAGALQFSNTAQYKLSAGVLTFGGLATTELAMALATDASGNLYSAYSAAGVEAGVLKFTSAGVRSTYALPTSGVVAWTGMKMGPGGYLYSARNFRALYRYTPGGGAAGAVWVVFPIGTSIADFDFDQNGNTWAAGNGTNIFCIQQSKTLTTTPFVGNIRSMRVYNGYLYFAAKTDAGEQIWRAQISSTTLGTPEVYYNFGASYPAYSPLAITFSSDGIMYVGTNMPEGLLIVYPSKVTSTPYSAYTASFGTGLSYFAWGKSDDLYASTTNGILLKITLRGKTSAPYFGGTL